MLNPGPRSVAVRPAAGGYILIEALITVLIFAIGLLGVVGLQTVALSSSSISNMRTEATVLAMDMADRMRANLGAADGTPGAGYDGAAPVDNACRSIYAAAVQGAPTACTPEELAADDMLDWLDQVQQSLPAGEGAVCIDSTPDDGDEAADPDCDGLGDAYAIKVWWSQRATRDLDAAEPMRFAMTVRP
jgi:type IV pilus assembly protein PilV